MLKELGYCYRKQSKTIATGCYAHRNEQFEIICDIVLVMSNQGPVLSIDCKKKECIGTADFVIDNLLWWWTEHGIHLYSDARNILLLCDAGGANSYRHYILKHRVMMFAKEIGPNCYRPIKPQRIQNGIKSGQTRTE